MESALTAKLSGSGAHLRAFADVLKIADICYDLELYISVAGMFDELAELQKCLNRAAMLTSVHLAYLNGCNVEKLNGVWCITPPLPF
jgi:hypothetical protein